MQPTESSEAGPWQREGKSQILRFRAIALPMPAFGLLLGCLLLLPVGSATVLIGMGLGPLDGMLPVRGLTLIFGAALGLALCYALSAALRSVASEYTVRLSPSGIEISAPCRERFIELQDIRILRWRYSSDFARLVVVTGGGTTSLLLGLRKSQLRNGQQTALPPIPEECQQLLIRNGLSAHRSRRAQHLLVFHRGD